MDEIVATEIRELIANFEILRMPWAFMRERDVSENDLSHGFDVDIWCPRTVLPIFIGVVLRNGWRVAGGRALGNWRSSKFTSTIRFYNPQNKYSPVLEIASGPLRWREVVYLSENIVQSSISFEAGRPYLIGVARLSILITRVALRGSLNGLRLERARSAWVQADKESIEKWRTNTDRSIGTMMRRKLERLISVDCNSYGSPNKLCLRLIAVMRNPAYLPFLVQHGIGKLKRLVITRTMRGIVCSIIGTDGSGKSTIAEKVSESLASKGEEVIYSYWGRTRGHTKMVSTVRSHFLNLLNLSEDKETINQNKSEFENFSLKKLVLKLAISAAVFVYIFDYWSRYFSQIHKKVRRKVVFLLDRGVFDLAVMEKAYPISRVLYRICPQPDLVIFCYAEADIIRRRKAERSIEEINYQQKIYGSICREWRAKRRGLMLDTNLAIEQNILRSLAMIEVVWASLQGKLDDQLIEIFVVSLTE